MTEQKRVKGKLMRSDSGVIKFVEDAEGDWYIVQTKWALGIDPYKAKKRFSTLINFCKKVFK